MAWRPNRWIRRWLIATFVWAVPVALITIHEIQVEMAYNRTDLQRALGNWKLSAPERAMDAAGRCAGTAEQARAAGCPAAIVSAHASALQAAQDDYARRRRTLLSYLSQAIFGYWVVPSSFVFAVGLVVVFVRLALRRPSPKRPGRTPTASSELSGTPAPAPPCRAGPDANTRLDGIDS
ncbi:MULTISPECIES: hypothetical protein [Burkholderiaceae]|uniref:hypothetical protein n=1 Tax=Burkholderiaceae TaxID=119060 RepID=UPI00095B0910|nr:MULTISPECIES: hypothetical protein [Burkholderiaceae]SIT68663.1 hypothetical protein SAMN04487769_1365 [Burkholderia sp. b14]